MFPTFKIQENVFNICQYREIYFLATATIPDAAQKACLVGRRSFQLHGALCSYSSDSDAWEESNFLSASQTTDSEFRTQIMQICCAVPSIQNIACFSELLKEVCIHQSRARIRVGNGNDGQIAEMYSYKMSLLFFLVFFHQQKIYFNLYNLYNLCNWKVKWQEMANVLM